MKVKFLVSMAGAIDRHPDDVDHVSAAEAKSLIAAGFAEATDAPVGRVRDLETAAASMAGVETTSGKRLFGAAAAAVLKKLARGG
jgi:hypothetical protein